MKYLIQIEILLMFIGMSCTTSSKINNDFLYNITIEKGNYMFCENEKLGYGNNNYILPFFNSNNFDSIYSKFNHNIIITADTITHFNAYLLTPNSEFVYAKIGNTEGWLKYNLPVNESKKEFLKDFFNYDSEYFPSYYILVYPFNNQDKVIITTNSNLLIANLQEKTFVHLDRIGGKLEGCIINRAKNCLKCNIDFGFGDYVEFDENGNEI